MFKEMWPIAPYTFSSLNTANTCCMAPLPTILTLWHSRVHVCAMNCCNITSYVKSTINNGLGVLTCLSVPDVNPYDSHVWLGRHLDNTRFWGKYNVVENVIILENIFNFIWSNTTVSFLADKRNTHNLEVRFGLWKSCQWYLIYVRGKWVLDILLDFLKIWAQCNIVSYNNYSFVINTDKISYHARLYYFEGMINISNVWVQFFNELLSNVIIYRDDNLFVRRAFGGH